MVRFSPLVLFPLLVTALIPTHAVAYDVWCADDPMVSIGGRLVDIQIQMPLAQLATMRSTTVTVVIPRNVAGSVVVNDVSAFPMTTTIAPSGPTWGGAGPLPITIVTDVSTADSYTIRLAATPLASPGVSLTDPTIAVGTTDVPLRMAMSLGR